MKIGLLGHGVVGSGVTEIIDKGETDALKQLKVKRILVKTKEEITDDRMVLNADEILDDPEIDVVCECMGGIEPAASYVNKALANGKSVVTSNKKMLAEKSAELFESAYANGVSLRYEAACGGGIPWINSLERIRRIDQIDSFRGIFNGTTNYILSRMEQDHIPFEEALKSAQKLGYAERDPRDDIDGYDVQYKTALSAYTAFDAVVRPEEIPVFGIRSINEEDMENAEKLNASVKLVGQGGDDGMFLSLSVLPVFVKKGHLFANIDANYNALECVSPTLGKAVFVGQGAGSLPTAHAVVQDLIDLSEDSGIQKHTVEKRSVSEMNHSGVYYIRTAKEQGLTAYIAQRLSDNGFITGKVPFMDISLAVKSVADSSLFFAEVME